MPNYTGLACYSFHFSPGFSFGFRISQWQIETVYFQYFRWQLTFTPIKNVSWSVHVDPISAIFFCLVDCESNTPFSLQILFISLNMLKWANRSARFHLINQHYECLRLFQLYRLILLYFFLRWAFSVLGAINRSDWVWSREHLQRFAWPEASCLYFSFISLISHRTATPIAKKNSDFTN